jgi:hypothetical protein
MVFGRFCSFLYSSAPAGKAPLETNVLTIRAGKFRELQRVTVQYARVLDMVGDEDAMEST